jgi:DNA polymerase III gamma/tau subunit
MCDACVSIAEDRNVDVIEMDAASRTGVDDVREIIDGVRYAPDDRPSTRSTSSTKCTCCRTPASTRS